jgi:hypothetical protein
MIEMAGRLSEKDRRAYAAVEAYKIGRGGVFYISRLFGMSPDTIKKGRDDLDDSSRLPEANRQRHEGAGRRGLFMEKPGLEEAFERLTESRTAGDPMNPDVRWTDLQPREIAERLTGEGFGISPQSVRSYLGKKTSANAKRAK